jgi:hypothetical protein
MAEVLASLVVRVFYAYALVGAVFALFFVIRGVEQVDFQARGASVGFRFLVFPGTLALWPLFLKRWLRRTGEPPEQPSPHR